MSKYVNKIVRVKCENSMTLNKIGVISKWDSSKHKYIVDFDNGWIGWYKRKQLEFI